MRSPVTPNFADVNLFKVMQSESFTVPTMLSTTSPAGRSSGYASETVFAGKREAVGGAIYAVVSDAAGPASIDFVRNLQPGDVVAMSAAGATTTVSINGTVVLTFASTAVAAVLGYYN